MIVAVDPGTVRCGVAVWEPGRKPLLIACFAMVPPHTAHYRPAFRRIAWLYDRFTLNIEALGLDPGVLVIEHLKGAAVPLSPGLDLMIITLRQWASERHWEFVEYSPRQWRQVVSIRGADEPDKDGVRWGMEAKAPELRGLAATEGGMDAVEAAGIGLYHAERMHVGLVQAAGNERRR